MNIPRINFTEEGDGLLGINIRELRKEDYSGIKSMIQKTWGLNKYCRSAKQLEATLEIYWRACLLQENYARVAEKSGVPVGLILGRVDKTFKPLKKVVHVFPFLWALLKFCLRIFQGLDFIKLALNEHSAYSRLLRGTKGKFEGEVVLFIVSEKQRGRGMGKKLMNRFLDHCSSQDLKRIYLFTDTFCNYGFYDRNGFNRTAETLSEDPVKKEQNPMKVFLYEYQF